MIGLDEASRAISKSLTIFRERKGISQEALATQLGRSQSYIAKIETGHRKVSLTEFLTICSSLEVSFIDLSTEIQNIYNAIQSKSLWNDNDNSAKN